MMEDLHRFTTYTIQLPNTERLPHNDDTWENPIDAANLILKKKKLSAGSCKPQETG